MSIVCIKINEIIDFIFIVNIVMDNNKVTEMYYGFIFVMKSNGTICGRFPMTRKECVFGRSDDCDIRILLDSVSAHHCIIFYLDDKVIIKFIIIFLLQLFILIF